MGILDMKKDDFCINRIICVTQRWKNMAPWSYLDVKRPDHGIYEILDGRCEYTMKNGEKITCTAGDVMYIPKGINYIAHFFAAPGQSDEYCNAYLANFNITDGNGIEAAFSDRIERIYRDDGGVLCDSFVKITDLYRKNQINETKSVFFKIISSIVRTVHNAGAGAVAEGLKYIESNFTSQISVGTLAEKCAMSETSFRRNFKEITGESPVKYINSLKIAKAKELLKSSEITIDEIADFLSFYDKAYFYKVFKNAVGVTPAEYRRARSGV